jgi:hypothetical protein
MESFEPLSGRRRSQLRLLLLAALMASASAAGGAETVKIYRSTMPDGSVVLSDRPASGARAVASHSYVLKAPTGTAEAERDYWRRQSDAFNLRQQQQDLHPARRRMSPRLTGRCARSGRRLAPRCCLSRPSRQPADRSRVRGPAPYASSPGARSRPQQRLHRQRLQHVPVVSPRGSAGARPPWMVRPGCYRSRPERSYNQGFPDLTVTHTITASRLHARPPGH